MLKRPSTKKEVRERSRHKLVRATLKELRSTSPASITTAAITKAAGLSQPSFYLHFESVEEALRVAADELTENLREALQHARIGLTREASYESVRDTYAAAVKALIDHRQLTELYLTYRRDRGSSFGRAISRLGETIREELVEDLRGRGLDEAVLGNPKLYVDLVSSLTLATVEALFDGRVENADEAIDSLARAGWGILWGLSRAR